MGYDSHPIVQALDSPKVGRVNIIPCSREKFMSITIKSEKDEKLNPYEIIFLDSMRFLSASLDGLSKTLASLGEDAYKITRNVFEDKYAGRGDKSLLFKKGIYPYNFVKTVQDFSYNHLPPKDAFFDNLKDINIEDNDYDHARKVWDSFQVKDFGEYTDLYCLLDVCILADVFENFRTLYLDKFKLDPCKFLSLPMIAWQAALKHSRVTLELIRDPDQYLFFEAGMRGGLATGGSIRYSKANNPYVPDYDPTQDHVYISYLDANALYSYGMSGHMPVRDFYFVPEKDLWRFTSSKILRHSDTDEEGYFLECTLEVDPIDHARFDDYPPMPLKRKVEVCEMSEYQRFVQSKIGLSRNMVEVEKLVADLTKRERYILHYVELKKYLEIGVKLVEVHRVLSFKQEPWLSKFINLCTEERKKATNDFEIAFWKLNCNSVYGKSAMSKRSRKRINVVRTRDMALTLSKKATISDVTIISDELALVTMKQVSVFLNTPIYTGVTCLGKSKALMYDFYYNFLQRNYGYNNVKLVGTDTDSVFVEVKCDDFYKDMCSPQNEDWFDRSDYPKDCPIFGKMYNGRLKKVQGKMKDVTAKEGAITEFVYLKPKLYAYKTSKNNIEKKAKGVPKHYVKAHTKFEDYLRVLNDDETTIVESKRIQSTRHNIYTISSTKRGMTSFDSKRYYVDNVNSLAYGNCKILELNT